MIFDAIRQGDVAEVRALLAADPRRADERTPDGATTVLWAAYTRHAELAELLLAGRAPDFFEACARGDEERAGELLAANRGLAAVHSADGFTGLGLAAFFGHREVARLALAAGADPNQASRNALHVTPLHSACSGGHRAVAELLLRSGADPNAIESSGMTPLHTAAGNGNRQLAACLLAAGAERARRSLDGRTPAGVARDYGHASLAVELD